MKQTDVSPGVGPRVDLLSQSISEVLKRSQQRSALAAVSGGALLGAAMFAAPTTPAYAQEDGADEIQEQIVVTGSRIPRRDFSANAPIMTVDEALFDETSIIGVETILNQMPQFVPAVTQFTTTDVQQTATNTVGVSTVSLRGLGPNRNLVLINGRRAMPVDPTMIVDTNSIPASAIARVEVISGGASAVYGADAVGGVVNFVLKDDYEGASVDIRVADTDQGGNQEITVSGLIGANVAGDRGNVMLGVERATRTKQHEWQRDWKLEDFANPLTPGGGFIWGGSPWINNERDFQNQIPNVPGFSPGYSIFNSPAQDRATLEQWEADGLWTDQTPNGTAISVDEIFDELPAGTIQNNIQFTNFRMNDDGTLFTGMGFGSQTTNAARAPGGYRYNGPIYDPNDPSATGGDHWGNYEGLPVFVRHPWGGIKENNLYRWASSPLERLSAFANGQFEVTDNIRVTAMASVTRTQTESSLGNTAANINQWAAAVPFGNELYRGNNEPLYPGDSLDRSIWDIPDSLCELEDQIEGGNIVQGLPIGCSAVGVTNSAYTIDGRFGVECDAVDTDGTRPWLDGQPGCTMSEAWPTSAEHYNMMMARPDPGRIWWGNRSPDYLREAIGAGRSTTNTTTTMNFSLGLEGELPSGNDFWDITISTGRSDNIVNQIGSVRLGSLRALYKFPNYGRQAQFDPEPVNDGFAENNSRCTTGLPIVERFIPSQDCVDMIAPSLKNQREMTQTVLEANIVGDLKEMRAGPLQYALGTTYRENSFDFVPDNLSHNQNFLDTIAGTYPNEQSFGEYDVAEVYGELLVPIISDGRAGVEHFTLELGGRLSEWSMPGVPTLETYKALIDWAITPRYRMRGGFNRAFRAPNLGELFITRTQTFGGFGSRDWCSQNLNNPGSFSASVADATQAAQTKAICSELMGTTGAAAYYDQRDLDEQPGGGGTGVANSFGNRDLREERADTFTLGMVMDFHDNFTLTVDWYEIEIEDMISLEGADSIYERCLSRQFNPTGDSTVQACKQVVRDQSDGTSQFTDRSFTNEGRALMSGADLQLNWQRPLGAGTFSLQSVANYNLKSETQDRPDVEPEDHKGYNDCSLQIQCQQYDYRIFSQFSYAQGPWTVTLRHQYWPDLADQDCRGSLTSEDCVYDSRPDYMLYALTGGYTFADRYRVNVGIENLFDKEPPCLGFDPDATAYEDYGGQQCQRIGSGGTYDPLGRRYFVSMTMDF